MAKAAGAGNRVRTDDLLITNQLLYQLSYAGGKTRAVNPVRALKQPAATGQLGELE